MLKKRYIKSRDVWKVTFEVSGGQLPEGIEIQDVHLVGEFNGWNKSGTPIKASKGDTYKVVLELQPSTTYQFRYLANGEYWFNDESADSYVPSDYGEDNCVVILDEGK